LSKKKNIVQERKPKSGNRAPQCSLQWWMLHRVDDGVDARRQYGAESREIDMEEDDSADYQQAADHQQAETPNFPPVEIKEDEENPWPHLSKQFAFQRKRGNSY